MALRQCDSAHCSGADAQLNEICKQEGWPVGHPVLTRDAQGACVCTCSCLAFGTPVEDGGGQPKAIEAYVVGDEVMTAGADLAWTASPVVYSGGTDGPSRQKFAVLVRYAETVLVVTSDHLFLLADEGSPLKRADRLAVGDRLVGRDGAPVAVTGVHIGDFIAGFHHIAATSKEPVGEDLTGHLLNTNGVVSADYTVQLYARTADVAGFSGSAHDRLPVVGSPEYVERYGGDCLAAPDLPATFDGSVAVRTAPVDVPGETVAAGTFVPAEATRIQVPPHACAFLPPDVARARQSAPKRAFNDPLAREWTESLISQHRPFYPEVTYSLDWASNEVNAYAWVENGVRRVDIKGGLVRDLALELEGISLVLAHELSHHYGGPPTFPGGLSCEGQADFFGVRNVMRRVWFGEAYVNTAVAAIAQMAAFFGVADSPTAPGGNAGCNHPEGACRVATYYAALDLRGKPGCAG
ncbi:Hint domain-containing protein [Streptomyces sp. NPDC001941]|uniref:Hint domain-containing protein n=1 Tax=Streptomyces sp. NPDC001941 TaxID=3154659 RepID=UPI0033309EEF